ncbi:MAG: hypothetical protein V1754_00230 [Pseudomonadota bacterium]
MKRWVAICGFFFLVLPNSALADEGGNTATAEEEAPPGSSGDEPRVPTADGDKTPGGQGLTVPVEHEPGKSKEEPAQLLDKKSKDVLTYGIGAHVRGIFIPEAFLNLFWDTAHPLASVVFGTEFSLRRKSLEIIGAVDFGFYSPPDGNWVEKNDDPATETDYVMFDDLSMLAFSVQFVWHHDFAPWVSLLYGVGAGLGVTFGDVLRVSCGGDPNKGGCNATNVEDVNKCYPKGMDPRQREAWLEQNTNLDKKDTPSDPHVFRDDRVWPVMPILDLVLGIDFKVYDHFNIRVVGGARDVFVLFLGATAYYTF